MGATTQDSNSSEAKLDLAQVCTLSPEGLGERLAWIRDEILPYATSSERLASGLAWELDAAPGLVEKLDHLVALERECCNDIVFERMNGLRAGLLRLEVRGIDPDAAIFRALYVWNEGARARGARLAKAGGLGLVTTLVACCALPLVAAAFVGGAVAAGLARLDQPLVIGVGTIVTSIGAWWWLGRRAKRRVYAAGPKRPCGPAC